MYLRAHRKKIEFHHKTCFSCLSRKRLLRELFFRARSARIRDTHTRTHVRMELEISESSVFGRRRVKIPKRIEAIAPPLPTPEVTTATTNPGDLMRREDVRHKYFTVLRAGNDGRLGRECGWGKRTLKCPWIPEKTFPRC